MADTTTKTQPTLTKEDFVSDQMVKWCPGCGDYAILAQVQQTLPKLGIPRENFVVISGIFFAGILVGGDAIQISLGLPAATVEIFNGTLLVFLIMGDYFLKHKVRLVFKSRQDEPSLKQPAMD